MGGTGKNPGQSGETACNVYEWTKAHDLSTLQIFTNFTALFAIFRGFILICLSAVEREGDIC
jgi:hypothetical protein